MKRLYAYTVTFLLIWAMWYFLCPYYMRMLEGFNFFTTLPDFADLNLDIPKPILMYISSFLLQLYACPAAGAAINAVIIILQVACIDIVVRKLFKNAEGLWWIALLTVPFSTGLFTHELTLVRPLICLAVTAGAAAVVSLVMHGRRPFIPLPRLLGRIWFAVIVSVITLGCSAFTIHDALRKSGAEDIARMDHLVESGQWDEIMERVSPKIAAGNEYMRKCVLLALTQTGRLADEAFRYGLNGSDDFYYQKPNTSILRTFNMMFFRHLDMHNPAVYHAYQQASLFTMGISFDSVRTLADIYLATGDYTLARKYMDILQHSTCHGKWLRERSSRLESIKGSAGDYVAEPLRYVHGKLKQDMSLMIRSNPHDRRYQDLLMCGLLADREVEAFYLKYRDFAKNEYAEGRAIPSIYQEALLMFLYQNPEELSKHDIDKVKIDGFRDFSRLIGAGKESEAKRKYKGTYWEYVYFRR